MRNDGADDDSDSGNFKDQSRSNDTHISNTDADARLYCNGDNASRLRYMGHILTDNRHGLVPTPWSPPPMALPSAKRPRQ